LVYIPTWPEHLGGERHWSCDMPRHAKEQDRVGILPAPLAYTQGQ